MKNKLRWIGKRIIDLVFGISILCICWFGVQVFIFSSFKIPSDSMGPELITGDNVLVFKPVFGARLFDVSASLSGKQINILRVPGFRKAKRDDVLVFNFPHPNDWRKIEMHILKYYIKRCVAIPGDTLSICNGYYKVSESPGYYGNLDAQKRLSERSIFDIDPEVFNCFPYDSVIKWNIKDFGPLYIPKKGAIIDMDRTNAVLYKKIIEWEQKGTVSIVDGKVLLDGNPIRKYEFKKNYYFMAGDRVEDSQDSRYWGLLPEEYIVGKAWIVWKSVDNYTGAYRWNRFLRRIN